MHTHDLDISIDKISKIEGHADLDIKIRDGEVKEVNLRVMENQRFYTQAVQGKSIMAVPQLVSRICGTCSIAHLTGCIEAAEKAIGVTPSAQTILLRKLTMYSLMIRDHALHLYFFVLPDLFGIDSVLDLPEDKKEILHEALHVKEAGNNLSKLIAGRAVHAPFEQIGGFVNLPDPEETKKVVAELKSVRQYVMNLAEMFLSCNWDFKRQTNFVALATPDFSFLEGEILTSSGKRIQENTEFKKEEIAKPSRMSGEAVGVIEAPRGTLYYWLKVKDGNVEYANLVIPTAQNLVNMREDIKLMVSKLIDQGEETIRKEAEKLIRAYDPCMSCASHFLKINWL